MLVNLLVWLRWLLTFYLKSEENNLDSLYSEFNLELDAYPNM
jgi:hypothetical protein